MAASDRILLVEGEADRAFFELICRNVGLGNTVTVAPPKDLAGAHNSREGVFNHLPLLLKQLNDGTVKRLAVVLDADSPPNGGFAPTRDRVTEIVGPFGYGSPANTHGGLCYGNSDGLADFGLWIMPNNGAVGMLEDWIKQCVHADERALLSHAEGAVAALPGTPKFSPIHLSKAEVATWLAWQKRPGHGLYSAVTDGLIDTKHSGYLELAGWLQHLFT
jgi:hypothetical protein